MTIQVPELQHPDIANAIAKAQASARNERALRMSEEIFRQEQDPMSTQNQLRKLQLEKVRGDLIQNTLAEATVGMGAIDWNDDNDDDFYAFDNHYKERLGKLGFDTNALPPGLRLTPIYKVGANGVQSNRLDNEAMRKQVKTIQDNAMKWQNKPSDRDSVGYANLFYRMSKDAYDEKKKQKEDTQSRYRMIMSDPENIEGLKLDKDEFNKSSKYYEIVVTPDTRWAWGTFGKKPRYVAVPKGFSLKTVTELSEQIGITPEEFTDDTVALMKEKNLTSAQAEKAIRKRYAK